jgi:poly(3-hydroxybutyrate) depolymerase
MTPLFVKKAGAIALAAGFLFASTQVPYAQQPAAPPVPGAPATGAQAPVGRGGGRGGVDPRVQQRTYTFTDTGEQLPYAVFVSSKVSKDKKAPLIVALHGLGGDQNTMMRGNALELAEAGGYILVGPMGYNSSGWYGAPATFGGGGRGGRGGPGGPGGPGAPGRAGGNGAPPAGAPGAVPPGAGGAPGGAPQAAAPGPGAGRGFGAVTAGGTAITDLPKLHEASEKDVMNVLDMIRKEFNVDENRTYLMGHSMGGAGTIYLGVKHASIWAAIGAEAPATAPAGLTPANYSLEPAKNIPMIIVQGDMDELVPVAGTRLWIDKMKELNITHQYVEVPGGTHGSVLTTGAPDIFAFFALHSKNSR